MSISLAERRTVQSILSEYDLALRACHRDGRRYLLFTDKGAFALFVTHRDEQSLRFMFQVTEYLSTSGFTQLCRVICTLSGKPWIQSGEAAYFLVDQPWGEMPRAGATGDSLDAARLLATLHQFGASLPDSPFDKIRAGKLPEMLRSRIEELKQLRAEALAGKKSFDKRFAEYATDFTAVAEQSLQALNASPYSELARNAAEQRQLCHGAFQPSHLIRPVDGRGLRVTGFHRAAVDLRVLDLARLCATLGGWDSHHMNAIIRAYDEVTPLLPGEFEVLQAWLRFPREFWWVGHSHYLRGETHKGWLKKLNHTAAVREVSLTELEKEVDTMAETPYRERFIPVTWESLNDPVPEVRFGNEPVFIGNTPAVSPDEWPPYAETVVPEFYGALQVGGFAEAAAPAPPELAVPSEPGFVVASEPEPALLTAEELVFVASPEIYPFETWVPEAESAAPLLEPEPEPEAVDVLDPDVELTAVENAAEAESLGIESAEAEAEPVASFESEPVASVPVASEPMVLVWRFPPSIKRG